MKFVLASTNRYWWPVKVRIPHPTEAGKIIEHTLKIQFEALPRDEGIKQQVAHSQLTSIEDVCRKR